ncbi:MAG: lysophospholipase [Myxococcota bacterium]|nr:lysophospholipase [Myxococcota bacterium]
MQVFLVHGMGRTPRSLALLAWRLGRAGMQVSSFGYRVREHDLASIAARFVAHVEERAAGPYAVIGHSLGNVVARLASPDLPPGLARLVMLAPPNRTSRVATLLRDSVVFRALTRDAGQRLGDAAFYDALPIPEVPTTVFAGTAGPRAAWLPLGGEISDGLVALEETRLPGAEHRAVAALHTFIMNDAEVTTAIVELLTAR